MRIRGIILLPVVMVLGVTAHAQWGIRFIIPQFEGVTDAGIFKQGYMGMGIDHDVSDRTAIGFDVFMDMQRLGDQGREVQTTYDGFDITYFEMTKVFGLQYRSQFFLSDEPKGFYLGSTIGIRQVRQSITLGYAYDYNSYRDPEDAGIEDVKEQSATTIPIGLRMGVRGELDGGYGDLYFGLQYQAGGGTALCKAPYLEEGGELSGMMIQFGFAYGVGW